MSIEDEQKEVVNLLINKKLLVTSDKLNTIKSINDQNQISEIKEKLQDYDTVTEDVFYQLFKKNNTCDIREGNVEVIFSYKDNFYKKREVSDFVTYFKKRYESISSILKNRPELKNIISISRILAKNESEDVATIGLISEVSETKNNNIMLTLEDPTGYIKVLINKNKEDLYNEAKDLVHDEVIGITGRNKNNIIFADNFIQPDIPINKEFKKGPDESYALFLSDFHIGSNNFLEEKFNNFLEWINGNVDNKEHKDFIDKIKYIFIAGDLIEGVGIYPGQDEELYLKSVYDQYKEAARLLNKIPKHIKIILCPGNHDALRLSEPQPPIPKELAPDLYDIQNLMLVSNPSIINIHKTENFSGFNVLMYHGYSFDYYISNVDSIRNEGGYHRADLIMKFLLKRRHLAPSHTSNLYIPDINTDPIVISSIPDFFVTGHIHYINTGDYNNTTLLCCSCWQSATSYQKKLGHDPEPCRVPMVNLKSRKVSVLEF